MLSLTLDAALACGGLFCDGAALPPQTVPVEQTEEVVVFAVDPVAETTTMHVQISYEGPVNEFAWILPVPGLPQLARSSERLFAQLANQTQESWVRQDFVDSSCFDQNRFDDADADTDADTDTDADADTDSDVDLPDVVVVSSGAVGPYDTVVLTATTADGLINWLLENEFQVPTAVQTVLAPYVAPGMHFVALKLRKDQDAGDVEPLAMTYPGMVPSIPMQLTALAAAEDMPLSVYLLGEERAFPENYLHVERNLLRAVWPGPNQTFVGNQPALLNEAVDAAGGQAFATLYAGDPPPMTLLAPDYDALRAAADPLTFFDLLSSLPPLTVDELSQILPLPTDADLTADTFFTCVSCYPEITGRMDFDPNEATERLIEVVIEPQEQINELLDHKTLTRLATSLSPAEMTMDPQFRFIEGLPTVSPRHQLNLARVCGKRALENTPHEITVEGRTFLAPTQKYLDRLGLSVIDWLANYYDGGAVRIEGVDAEGRLVTLADNSDQLPPEDWENRGPACGCDQRSGVAITGMLPLLGLLLRRQRRR